MRPITIQVESYGAVTRFLPAEFSLALQAPVAIDSVLAHVVKTYPQAEQAVSLCACAIEDEIVVRKKFIEQSCTLVLLSPVAGG